MSVQIILSCVWLTACWTIESISVNSLMKYQICMSVKDFTADGTGPLSY